MMNLFVAVVLQGFDNLTKNEDYSIKPEHLEHVLTLWQDFDRKATGFIGAKQFSHFMTLLPPPLGWSKQGLTHEKKRLFIKSYSLPVFKFQKKGAPLFYFYDIIITLAKNHLQNELIEGIK